MREIARSVCRRNRRGVCVACRFLFPITTGSHTYLALSSQLGSAGRTQFVWTFDEGLSLDSISSQSEVVCSTDVVLVLEVAIVRQVTAQVRSEVTRSTHAHA